MDFDRTHWEELIGVIIERIGPEQFVEMRAYCLEQIGCVQLARYIGDAQILAATEMRVTSTFGSGVEASK